MPTAIPRAYPPTRRAGEILGQSLVFDYWKSNHRRNCGTSVPRFGAVAVQGAAQCNSGAGACQLASLAIDVGSEVVARES